jgi:glycosyltransferase involved in cell wall biosynthesis
MKKICFVATVEFAINVYLLSHLRALGQLYDITVIVNTNDTSFLLNQGVDARVIKLNIAREISPINDLMAFFRLVLIFRRHRFDAVHSIMPKSGLLAMLAAYISRVPFRVHTFTGQVWANKVGVKRLLIKQFDCFIANLSTNNMVDSPSQLQFLLNEKIVTKEKSFVCCNGSIAGVDIDRFKLNEEARINIRQQLNIDKNALVFLFLGRLTKDKGVLDLAQAFVALNNNDVHLLFVGPDEQSMQPKIEKLAQLCARNIHFVGYTPVPEQYMAASDVFCLPSYREGFGGVIIEAASVGIPSIASRIYGITDAIVENETGLLHQPKNANDIKLCIENLINDKSLRVKLGKKAKERAVKVFNKELLTQSWLDFYKSNLHD